MDGTINFDKPMRLKRLQHVQCVFTCNDSISVLTASRQFEESLPLTEHWPLEDKLRLEVDMVAVG